MASIEFALCLIAGTFPAAAQGPERMIQRAPDPRFGVVNAWADPDAAADLGVGWELLTFEWAALQAEPGGDLVRDAVDVAYLEAAREAGREVVGLITGTPAWASESGDLAAVPDGLALPHSDAGNHWAQFVAALVAEFGPLGVTQWVIYDAPDVQVGEGAVGFAGSAADYAQMLRAARLAADTVDGDTRLWIGALEWWADAAAGREPYLARLLVELRHDPDAAAYGYYTDGVLLRVVDSTAGLWTVLDGARAILAEFAPEMALWLLVNAAPTLDADTVVTSHMLGQTIHVPGAPLPRVYGITPEQQADFVVQAVSIALALGVQRVGVTQLVDDLPAAWGLIRADGSRRPAFEAYAAARDLFAGVDGGRVLRNPAGTVLLFEGPDRQIVVVWAAGDNPVTLTITSPEVGEPGALYVPAAGEREIVSQAVEWPGAFVVQAPAATRDGRGFLTVAGSPRVLSFPRADEFFRVIYLDIGPERVRLQ